MLLPEWKKILRKAWSVRLLLVATVLSALEAGVQYYLTGTAPLLATGAALLSLAAGVSRVIAQPKSMGTDA